MTPQELPRESLVRYKQTGPWLHRRGQMFRVVNPCDDGLGANENAGCRLLVDGNETGEVIGIPRRDLELVRSR